MKEKIKKVYVGIDVSKETLDVCLPTTKSEVDDKNKTLFKYVVYNNNKTNIERFIRTLNNKLLYNIRAKKEGLMEWHVVFENTGLYHKILMKLLWESNIKFTQVSSYKAKQFHKTLDPNGKQSDKSDARELLLYGKMHRPKESEWKQENEEIRLMRSVWRQQKKNLQKTRQNEHNLVFFMSGTEKKNEKILFDVIKRTKKMLGKGRIDDAKSKIISTVVLFSDDEMEQNRIIDLLEKDVNEAIEYGIRNNVVQQSYKVEMIYEKLKNEQQKLLYDYVKNLYPVEFECIESIPGVGENIIIESLIATDGFKKFDNVRQFINYIGLANMGKDSGTSVRSNEKLGKHSDRILKVLLRTSVASVSRYNDEVREVYERKLISSKKKGLAVTTGARKLAKQMFYCARKKIKYVPASER